METITSRKNEKVIHLKKLGADRAYRRSSGAFLCDGEKLLREAVLHGAKVQMVFTCGELKTELPAQVPVYSVSRDLIENISPMKNPQDVLFSCEIPENRKEPVLSDPAIVLENLQDPGNLGTILRTANAFQIKTVVLVGACADPYNPKTVRASMGAVFRQSVAELDYETLICLKERGVVLAGAALDESSQPLDDADLSGIWPVIGSEGQGLSERMLALCEKKVVIPMDASCESLNAGIAAAIIMWEMRKYR